MKAQGNSDRKERKRQERKKPNKQLGYSRKRWSPPWIQWCSVSP